MAMPAPQERSNAPRVLPKPEPRLHYITFDRFQGMDTQSNRIGLDNNRLAWLENLQPLGDNSLVEVPGPVPALATFNTSATRTFFATYGNNDYAIVFMSDGSGWQINLSGGAMLRFAQPFTFVNPDMTQWAADRILIVDPSAGYCEWDGSVFIQSGAISPNIVITNGGSGYSIAPTVSITGGAGVGAAAVAVISGGAVVAINIVDGGGGYKATDTLTVTITGGGGINAAATAIVWPQLTFPNMRQIAVFQGRVWIGANRTLFFTGTKGFDDALAVNASGSLIITDADLPHTITVLRNLNNFLYIFGEGSIKQISNITVSGTTTLFVITTLTSDQGSVFPLTVVAFNRLVMFANFTGVFAIFGATVERVSDPMDGVYRQLDFSQELYAVTTDLQNNRVFMLLARYKDTVQGNRSLFLCFMNRKWFLVSQGTNIKTAIDATIGGNSQVFVSSGNDITKILADKTVALSVKVSTALSDNNLKMQNKRGIRVGVAQISAVTGTMNINYESENRSIADSYPMGLAITWINASSQIVTWQNASLQTVTFVSGGFLFQDKQFSASGIYLGITLTGTVVNFSLLNVVIEYESGAVMRSRNTK